MILTYKLKHDMDFNQELSKARKIAEYAIKYRTFSSKDVKHIGLKSMIANQILRKFGNQRKARRVKSVKLIISNQGIKLNKDSTTRDTMSQTFISISISNICFDIRLNS